MITTFLKILFSLCAVAVSAYIPLTRKNAATSSVWLPNDKAKQHVRLCEVWFLKYGVFWILAFGIIVGAKLFVYFDKIHYIVVCGGLASPLLLQPFFAPSITGEENIALLKRYSFQANLWVALFSFVGNYWYTHYFYSVLEAQYTMPSWDFNGVPIAMYFATHFYFCFYHALSNAIQRKIVTTFTSGRVRALFTGVVILLLSYTTAFAETLTISGFPCYTFKDRDMVYWFGSAFYGIYFVVSFPMYFRFTETFIRGKTSWKDTAIQSLATGMLVLTLLDFVRIAMGKGFSLQPQRPCKLNARLTCAPFDGEFC
eukprot:g439.t1